MNRWEDFKIRRTKAIKRYYDVKRLQKMAMRMRKYAQLNQVLAKIQYRLKKLTVKKEKKAKSLWVSFTISRKFKLRMRKFGKEISLR